MKVIIIEDEKLTADYLTNLLLKIDSSIEIVQVYESVKDSILAFNSGITADLIFVDIHLSDGISFDIFSKISIDFPIIFTTAYDQYAIKAFKLNSIDYLLKPIGLDELKNAIEKFKRIQNHSIKEEDIQSVLKSYISETKQYKNRFMVKSGDVISSINVEDIAYFVSEDGIVLLVTKNSKRYAIDYKLEQLESYLESSKFFRINRKVIISIDSIEKVSSFFNSRLKVKSGSLNDESSIISRERVGSFKQWLDGNINA